MLTHHNRQAAIEESLKKSIDMYNSISFNKGSYWFTLLIEFSSSKPEKYNIKSLKDKLVKLDENSKKYFANIEVDKIPDAEKKYFEYVKEAVNEKSARSHRGTHIRKILESCKKNSSIAA